MSKVIGGILLVVGAIIGGGMLALPIVTASTGFLSSAIALLVFWLLNTFTAFLMLEANYYLPSGSNLISMVKQHFGHWGASLTWVCYLALLYALLCAYIAGGSDLFSAYTKQLWPNLPENLLTLIYVVLFASIVYVGVRAVDWVNRGLMCFKLAVLATLLTIMIPHVQTQRLLGFHPSKLTESAMVLVTSFTFAMIVPTLRDYFEGDIKNLKRVIWIGSVIPLICYTLWIGVVMGVVPLKGTHGLLALIRSHYATSALVKTVEVAAPQPIIGVFFKTFSGVCMLTAFLSMSLCLFDFLADGTGLRKDGIHGFGLIGLVFVPPTVLVMVDPSIYVQALRYAGILCTGLLMLLPTLLVLKSRSLKDTKTPIDHARYRAPVSSATLWLTVLAMVLLLCVGLHTL